MSSVGDVEMGISEDLRGARGGPAAGTSTPDPGKVEESEEVGFGMGTWYPGKEKREAYLKRFGEYCKSKPDDIGLSFDHFEARKNDKVAVSRIRGLSNNVGREASVFALHDIGLEAVGHLGAYSGIDPGFFATHLFAVLRHDSLASRVHREGPTADKLYWSFPCCIRGSERFQNHCWTGQVSFYTMRKKKIILLVDDSSQSSDISIVLPMLAEHEMSVHVQSESRSEELNARAAGHFEKLFTFPPTTEILELQQGDSRLDRYARDICFEILMKLTTWQLSLDHVADFARRLDHEAILKPSKLVLQSLNKCHSLVLQMHHEVQQLRKRMKKSAGYKYSSKYLLEAMVAVKQQHPQFDWIPKPQNTDSIDAVATERTQGQTASSDDANHDTLDESLIPRMLSRIEQRAEKQSAQLRMTFQALTTAITIEDSDFNKKQAQRSTMLTLLAAIYLPLTLATGIFGMNIQEINGGTPRWWIVVVVTAILFVPSLSFIYILFVGEGVKKKF